MPDAPGPIAPLIAKLEPRLGALEGEPEALSGGITNRNYRVRLGGADYVVRVSGKDTDQLGIDREAERAATAAAGNAGVGPEVAAFLPDDECLVTRFIPGRPVPPEELTQPETLAEVAASVRAFHGVGTIPSVFATFRIPEEFRARALERSGTIPPAYVTAAQRSAEIEAALRGPEHEPVACHNDLLNANFIREAGGHVRIVDWEYAGMNDRYFDLGNMSINNGFDETADEVLLAAYFGEPCTARRFACLRLMRIMSDFRESMWGVLQGTISELDFDYGAYAAEHFERLLASASDPRYPTWLEDARGA